MTTETAERQDAKTAKLSRCLKVQTGREKPKRFSEKLQVYWELNTLTFQNAFLSGFLHRHELSLPGEMGACYGLDASGHHGPFWNRGDRCWTLHSKTGDGEENWCSSVWLGAVHHFCYRSWKISFIWYSIQPDCVVFASTQINCYRKLFVDQDTRAE